MQDFVTTGFNLNFFDMQEDATESFVGVTTEADLPTPTANVQNASSTTGPGGGGGNGGNGGSGGGSMGGSGGGGY